MKTRLFVSLLLVMLLLCLLTGCSQPTSDNLFRVEIVNNCDDGISGLRYSYATGGVTHGGGGAQLADGTPLPIGDTLTLYFTAEGFPETADLSTFTCEVSVVTQDGGEAPAGEPISIAATQDGYYRYSLSGNVADGFALTPVV